MTTSVDEKIKSYIDLLKRYNSHTNVYAKSAYHRLDFHIEDSIQLSNIINDHPGPIIDIGSGSGFPGIIMGIMLPDRPITLIDSKHKKTTFLTQVKDQLSLENIQIITQNINEYLHHHPHHQFGIVTAKAFGHYDKITPLAKQLLKKKGRLCLPISQHQHNEYPKHPQITTLKQPPYYYLIEQF